ncbi:hypothetical protein QYS49_33685 [Marivirga salinae]|uniref:O-antigen ligase domain-containing protein n=1 Tax=Marivirga salinarum TaxID=3059078 RepID=A0AA51NBQ3_9BACT|nr:hypothetical protein [Marivirga sp. BDSF4-3]WMN12471.1 hypothetical protein QYS49_33685 [Marivirga sp. BDSF4-3]
MESISNILDTSKNYQPTSLGEKVQEIVSSKEQLMSSYSDYIFGNGYGWRYELPSLVGKSSERHYVHISLWYFILCYGIFGLTFFLLLVFKTIKLYIYKTSSKIQFYAILGIFIIFASFSTNDMFVNFLPGVILGNLFSIYFTKN